MFMLSDYLDDEFDTELITRNDLKNYCKLVGDFLYAYDFKLGGFRIRSANTNNVINEIIKDIDAASHIEISHDIDDLISNNDKLFDNTYVVVFKLCSVPNKSDYYVIYQEEK